MSLVAFDFDGTLSDSEMTVLLAKEQGVADQVEDITTRAMNDEISYAESLRTRVELLAGLTPTQIKTAFESVTLRTHAADILIQLREAGHTVVILTGGFERGVQTALRNESGYVDEIVANRLQTDEGVLTGDVSGPLIEDTKDEVLYSLAHSKSYDVDETVAIGDGANDLPMLQVADHAIGFNPKPAVSSACDITVESMLALGEAFANYGLLDSALR